MSKPPNEQCNTLKVVAYNTKNSQTFVNFFTVRRCHSAVKVKVVDLYSASTRSVSKALRYSTHCQGITQFYLHTLLFICKWNELYLPLPSQPQLVLIYRPRRDGGLSIPWCEVAPAKIRTCNFPIANLALSHSH